jgi:hypothetical protein
MERLIELDNNNKLVIQPEALAIPAYKTIWDRDKTKNKDVAIKELTYIWFRCSLDKYNPYKQFYGEERNKRILEDVMFDGWKPDKQVAEAVIQFEKNNYTMGSKLINSALAGCNKLISYFQDVDLTIMNDNGTLVHKASDLMKNLSTVGKVLEGLKELEKQQHDDEITSDRIRGGGKIGAFED